MFMKLGRHFLWSFLTIVLVLPLSVSAQESEPAAAAAPPPPEVIEQTEDYVFSSSRIAVWLDNFRTQALAAGVAAKFFDETFAHFTPDASIVKSSRHQPEFKIKAGAYVTRLVSNVRLQKGKELLFEKAELLEKLERLYGVDRHILVAIWGIETNYGTTMGNHHVIFALATLAVEGSRKKFAEQQLLALLPVLEKEGLPVDVKGSWAGAMGQMQFIPTTYADFARDVDGDGKRDIWHSLADSLGSAAYYLKRSGWVAGLPWGLEVETPPDFSFEKKNDDKQSIAMWIEQGYKPAHGTDARYHMWQEREARVVKVTPDTPAFLATKNFNVLLRYNNATLYALAVGRLADRLRGAPLTKTAWLKQPLERWSMEEMKEAQTSLFQLGFDGGTIDGIKGIKTLQAFHAWQASVGLEKGELTKKVAAQLNKQAATLTASEIKHLQESLARLGFKAGHPDGLVGAKTRQALKAFQEKSGFAVNGTPSRAMLIVLREKVKKQEAQNDTEPAQPPEQSEPVEAAGAVGAIEPAAPAAPAAVPPNGN